MLHGAFVNYKHQALLKARGQSDEKFRILHRYDDKTAVDIIK